MNNIMHMMLFDSKNLICLIIINIIVIVIIIIIIIRIRIIIIIYIVIKNNKSSAKAGSGSKVPFSASTFGASSFFASTKYQWRMMLVPFNMAIGNVELVHESFPQHLRMHGNSKNELRKIQR